MAEEHYEDRTRDLNDSLNQQKVNQLGKPLEVRIKQEGLLQRLGRPLTQLVHWTAVAIKAMWDETQQD